VKTRYRAIAGIIGVAAVAAGAWTIKVHGKAPFYLPAYKAERVVDGDTFVTTDNQMIRLANVNAPETGRCGSEEATQELSKLVMNKPIFMKIVYRDGYNRLVSFVYNPDGSVNARLAERGLVVWSGYQSENDPELTTAGKSAKEMKLGIYSDKCTQSINIEKPVCSIKGNIREGVKNYRYPGCGQYNNTLVQLYLGEEWFCSDDQAEKAGYAKAADCPKPIK
jgi:micrococcal nuclease